MHKILKSLGALALLALTAASPSPVTLGGVIYASGYGVKADGSTSDDVALKAALDACSAAGTTLMLPPGQIKLTGAAGSITVQNCAVQGVGIPAGSTTTASQGSAILLTSTTVKPFIVGNNWRWSGTTFYWPNQTSGTTVYPALFNMDIDSCVWEFNGNTVINAYDWLVDTPGHCQANWNIHDNNLYAVHDLMRSSGQGDAISVSNNQMTPGPWLGITNNGAAAAIDAASPNNTIFHVTNNVGFGWNLTAIGNRVFNWRYGFKLDATGNVSISNINMIWDGTQTLVDSSSGGLWLGNVFTGHLSGCWGYRYVSNTTYGNAPCINLGATGAMMISGFAGGSSSGSFIKTAGANVYLLNSTMTAVGGIADGGDYYMVNYTGNPGGLVLEIQGNVLSGLPSSTKVHGIGSSNGTTASRLVIQNNEFLYFNDDITAIAAGTMMVQGNWSVGTQGTTSVAISGSNPTIWGGNQFDKPPAAVPTACGTGASATGTTSGTITVGSTNPTTACTLTLPFTLFGGAKCFFSPNGFTGTINGSVSGNVASIVSTADMHNGAVFYNCPGQQ